MTDLNLINKTISINEIDALIFDFDGVLTNNLVYIDENGFNQNQDGQHNEDLYAPNYLEEE